MDDMAHIVSRKLENKIAITEDNNQSTLLVMLDMLKEILALLKEKEKAGTWKQIDDDTNIWSCSECDEPFILIDGTPIENKYYYCPHCGAKMQT